MLKKILLAIIVILIIGFIIPYRFTMPVEGATRSSYDQHSFWAYPWGKSVTHKGVDIFAKQGTPVLSSASGLVIYISGASIWITRAGKKCSTLTLSIF